MPPSDPTPDPAPEPNPLEQGGSFAVWKWLIWKLGRRGRTPSADGQSQKKGTE